MVSHAGHLFPHLLIQITVSHLGQAQRVDSGRLSDEFLMVSHSGFDLDPNATM